MISPGMAPCKFPGGGIEGLSEEGYKGFELHDVY